ncbi:DMT family transporter [Bacillus sp. FJAT-44742]|uniref:DMT family transporter n=1 Tax=Bacillus sp. FJAT-44742 TaxID=2014005 RepID=UPI000C23AAE1|nr:DMT family transporter [Bacillus sp. FJAT-44742]
MEQRRLWPLYVLIFSVMLVWGLNVVALKVLVDFMAPASMQALRIFLAGLTVFIIIFLRKSFRKLTKKEWKITIAALLFGVVGHHFFLAMGLTETTASNASIILALLPVTTSVLAMMILGDPLTKLRFVGILSAFTGVFLIVFMGDGDFGALTRGDIFIFLGMATQALSFIFIRQATSTISPALMTGYMFIVGSFFLLVLSVVFEPNGIREMFTAPLYVWAIFIGSAVLATAVGHQLFNGAIQKIGAGETAVFNNLVPFFGLVSSALLLGENITLPQIASFTFIVIGVLFGTGYVEKKFILYKNKKRETDHLSL